jgi:uncharacterized protein
VVVSELARVEVPAALWRKHRLRDLSGTEAGELVVQFEWDWFEARRFDVMPARHDVLESAAGILAGHPLRAFDAVQLASALAAREADPELIRFACFDRSLATAAAAEGFQIIGSG